MSVFVTYLPQEWTSFYPSIDLEAAANQFCPECKRQISVVNLPQQKMITNVRSQMVTKVTR